MKPRAPGKSRSSAPRSKPRPLSKRGPKRDGAPASPSSRRDDGHSFSKETREPPRSRKQSRTLRRVEHDADVSQKLHKVLAQAGLGSRRTMEEWIRLGRVTINGKAATIGDRVLSTDRIAVDHRPIRIAHAGAAPRVLLYHKPEGEIVTRDDPEGRTTVFSKLPHMRGAKWQSIGRLDVNTSGLLIFTTSGEFANRMMHPRFEVEREYSVRILGQLTPEHFKLLLGGLQLADGLAQCTLLEEAGGEGANRWYRLVVKEGRNRLVRRMFEALHFAVSRLIRVRFGVIGLPPRLKRGQSVELPPAEVQQIEQWLAQTVPTSPDADPPPPAETRNHRRRSSAAT